MGSTAEEKGRVIAAAHLPAGFLPLAKRSEKRKYRKEMEENAI